MKYHVVLSRFTDIETFAREATVGKRPRHAMLHLARKLGATIHEPVGRTISLSDRILAKISGNSNLDHWAMARALSSRLTSEDAIFAIGEDAGFPLAILCGRGSNAPKICVFVHNLDAIRNLLTMKLFRVRDGVDLFMTNTAPKADFIRRYLNLPEERVYLVTEQTDTQFFTPGAPTPGKGRPIVGSGGLEQRDYRTLASATRDLEIDVRVCAISPNAAPTRDTFPQRIPANMSVDHYDWPALRQLYRDSDIVVISLKPHGYQAGLTTLFESLACMRPVIMTRTPGLVGELIDAGAVTGVEPFDVAGMREAILRLLSKKEEAETQAQRGYELVRQHHSLEQFVDNVAAQFTDACGESLPLVDVDGRPRSHASKQRPAA